MRKATLGVGLFLGVLVFLGGTQAHASPISSTNSSSQLSAFSYDNSATDTRKESDNEKKIAQNPTPAVGGKIPVQHIVVEGETLTMIAEKHTSTWMRLFAKNTQVADPNVIAVGEKITIPDADEQLPDRPLPTPPPQAAMGPPASSGASGASNAARGNSAGNTYSAGYCTWYAKDRRPDLPNNLGNADTWAYRAQSMGIATGSTPRAGAIGQQGMHVVYIEGVNPDNTVTISEMNYQGLYVISSRTAPAGSFMYIY